MTTHLNHRLRWASNEVVDNVGSIAVRRDMDYSVAVLVLEVNVGTDALDQALDGLE
jgi:hypothetical protein